ncbi:MAG: hypothetical protein ABW072_06750 [Sedimenticola sp.]
MTNYTKKQGITCRYPLMLLGFSTFPTFPTFSGFQFSTGNTHDWKKQEKALVFSISIPPKRHCHSRKLNKKFLLKEDQRVSTTMKKPVLNFEGERP